MAELITMMSQSSILTPEESVMALSFGIETGVSEAQQKKDNDDHLVSLVEPDYATRTRGGFSVSEITEATCNARDDSKVEIIIPDWLEDDYDTEDESSIEGDSRIPSKQQHESLLEQLPPDVSALLLAHLPVQDLHSVALCSRTMFQQSRSNALWKSKFLGRWNTDIVREQDDWCLAYQRAYKNNHDLWITHWNIVLPMDGDSPGRCCVPEYVEKEFGDRGDKQWSRYCPSCRYSRDNTFRLPPMVRDMEEKQRLSTDISDTVYQVEVSAAAHGLLLNSTQTCSNMTTTQAQATFASAQYSVAKWCHNVTKHPNESNHAAVSIKKRAERAFKAASTFYRTIDSKQYSSDSLNFLKDSLFFATGESLLSSSLASQAELESMKKELYLNDNITAPGVTNTVAHLGPHHESARHTWHVVRFTNPDFCRPLTFRIFVQRCDCFTVYPSEGYLEPGETCHIVLGVRLLGSLIAEAYEAINVQREQVDPFLANVYAHEAHLPYAPFSVRYMYAPVSPCIPPAFTSRGESRPSLTRPAMPHAAISKYKHVIDYLWEHVATEVLVRTQYLSAHVHANYRFEEFQLASLFPFDLAIRPTDKWGHPTASSTALVHVAPQLQHRSAKLFAAINNTKLETEFSDQGESYRSEKSCRLCSTDWGVRSEELGRTHLLQLLICEGYRRHRRQEMDRLISLIRVVYRIVHGACCDWHDVYRLLYKLHCQVVQRRAVPLLGKKQCQALSQLEITLDRLCIIVHGRLRDPNRSLHAEKTAFIGPIWYSEPWREGGVYRHRLCTDSIYGEVVELPSDRADEFERKDEPDDLDWFRRLCHSPGRYCLGIQHDPNHRDAIPIFDAISERALYPFLPKNRVSGTDVFMDEALLAVGGALSMLNCPRSLIVHGVFDRVRGPGTLIRCPAATTHLFERIGPRIEEKLIDDASSRIKNWSLPQGKISSNTKSRPHVVCATHYCCLDFSDLDPDGHELLHIQTSGFESVEHKSFLRDYLDNVPPLGVGQFPISTLGEEGNISVLTLANFSFLELDDQRSQENVTRVNHGNRHRHNDRFNPLIVGNGRGPRLFNLLWTLSAHLGWNVDGEQSGEACITVDRRFLIATQWVANSISMLPLLFTLLARATNRITIRPIEYHLEGLPYDLDKEMRYLSSTECAIAAMVVCHIWLRLGRHAERRLGRTYERAMQEHISKDSSLGSFGRITRSVVDHWQRRWDRDCPFFFQCLIFMPRWNKRTYNVVQAHFSTYRSKDLREHRSLLESAACRGTMDFGGSIRDGKPSAIVEESSFQKFITGGLVALGSFTACSPHILLNLMIVFGSSIGLGMSMALQFMEAGRGIHYECFPNQRSILTLFSMNTTVIAFFMMGHIVGSSGGILFLAEFIVTSVSLVLGGAGTISASAIESWVCFVCLAWTAFWGHLFARVALMDGMRQKRRVASSTLLFSLLVALSSLLMISLLAWKWSVPPVTMIVRDVLKKSGYRSRKVAAQHLQ